MLKLAFILLVIDVIADGIAFAVSPYQPLMAAEFFLTCLITALVSIAFLRFGRSKG